MNFGFIADGQHQVAEVALASELLGWRAIDAAARILAGEGPGRAETPELAVIDGHPDILAGGSAAADPGSRLDRRSDRPVARRRRIPGPVHDPLGRLTKPCRTPR